MNSSTKGGGLLVTAGDKTDIRWYNQYLAHPSRGLLPMKINDIEGDLNDDGQSTRIVAQHFEHPAMDTFNDRRNGNLADAQVNMWQKLAPANPDIPPESPEAPVTLAILESGDPLIVEQSATGWFSNSPSPWTPPHQPTRTPGLPTPRPATHHLPRLPEPIPP